MSNYDPASVPGVYIYNALFPETQRCIPGEGPKRQKSWILSDDEFDPEDFGLEAGSDCSLPDLSIDPSTHLLTVVNPSDATRSYFITLTHPTVPVDVDGNEFEHGTTVTETGEKQSCVTLLLVLRPKRVVDACYLLRKSVHGNKKNKKKKKAKKGKEGDQSAEDVDWDVVSDVKDVRQHSCPSRTELETRNDGTSEIAHKYRYPFPLCGNGPFFCSQGFNGAFTHFYPGTYHALDFQCPIGTPVLSLHSGKIHALRQRDTVSGIHVTNLFNYNSVMVAQDDGAFVEYVHIQVDSCPFAVGDMVKSGDVIALTGDVGFCPVPHLHLQVHESPLDGAETIAWSLLNNAGSPYVPIAGKWYNRDGQVDADKVAKIENAVASGLRKLS